MKKEDDDTILMVLRKSRRSFLLEYLSGAFLIILLAILYSRDIKFGLSINFAIVGLALVSFGSAEISRLVHRCKITASKLVIIDGLIKQSRKHIYIKGISDIDVSQKVIQRLLNYGKIHIKSMSGESSLEIKDIACPGRKMAEIEKIIERYKNR